MSTPRIIFLVHGGPDSIESVRARQLSLDLPPDSVKILFREKPRQITASLWHKEIKAFAPDLLYVINTALPGSLLACWWRLRHGLPFVIDTGDVVYEMALSAGTHSPLTLPLLKWIESSTHRYAHTVVVRGTKHQQLLQQRGLKRVVLIRDGFVEPPQFKPSELDMLRRGLRLENKFVVGVLGSLVYSPRLQICYGWDLVMALTHLKQLPIHGLVIGDGPGLPWLEKFASDQGVSDRITFAGRVPYVEVPLYLQLLDIAISTQTNNLAGQVRTTGKIPEYMANERFIFASRVGEAALVLPKEMLLEYEGEVDVFYPQLLANQIREVYQNRHLLDARKGLKAIAEQNFSYAVLRKQFNEVIAGIKSA